MRSSVLEVGRSLAMWRIWTRLGLQDVRLRFRRTAIGVGWIFLNLTTMILAVGFIYGNLFGQDMRFFIPYLTASLVLWNYVTSSIVEGGNAFIGSEGYIKQISLPLYIYVFRSFVSIGLVGLINLAVYVAVAILYGVPLTFGTLWLLPGIVVLLLTSLLLIAIFAHVNARFRDAGQLASTVMQVMMYVTPIIYPETLLRERGYDIFIDINPFYHLIQVVRQPLLVGEPAAGLSYLVGGLLLLLLATTAFALIRMYRLRIVYEL